MDVEDLLPYDSPIILLENSGYMSLLMMNLEGLIWPKNSASSEADTVSSDSEDHGTTKQNSKEGQGSRRWW